MDNSALDANIQAEELNGNVKNYSGNTQQRNESSATSEMSIGGTSSHAQLATNSTIGSSDLYYTIEDEPPWYLTLTLGFQHYLTVAGSSVSVPFILCPAMCMLDDDVGRAEIISTIMLVSGIVTLCQSTIGTRLPIIQGGSFSFITPALAILALPEWKCPSKSYLHSMTQEERTEEWQRRMRELQGAIIISSIVEVALGLFGIVGIILKFITPMTVAPAIALIGLSLFKVSARHAAANWGIASLTIVLIIIFSQYLKNVKIPVPFTRSKSSGRMTRYPVFEVFPFLLTIAIVWTICAILTTTGALPKNDAARTDVKVNIIEQTGWFLFPYPLQWGLPTISLGAVLGMVSGVIASVVESIGDYYACARISGAPPPPKHAINRGIFVEGVGCIIAGVFGTGNGTTSFSENIGAISVTKVGSRRVIQAAGIIMIVFSLFGKIGAVFVSIPEPIIGGIFCIVFATVTAVGLSNLQGVDLNSSRNIFVVGFSIFFGLLISQWMDDNKGVINVGVESIDQIISILLSTGMFVSGFLGFLLDNTIPGTPEERGLLTWSSHLKALNDEDGLGSANANAMNSYDLPFGMEFIRRTTWLKYLPVSPTFRGFRTKLPKLPISIGIRNKNKISTSPGDSIEIQNNMSKDRLKVYNAD